MMKYLSLFSGIGGFEVAIQTVFPDAECVGYSEIDKYAIQTYQKHFLNHQNFGSITDIDPFQLPNFDLLVGGFPCQDLSIAKNNRQGLKGSRSGLFYQMMFIHKVKQPRYFCYENVASMKKEDRDYISQMLGVEPVMINAALVSGQNRKRLFWCNWKVEQPEDRGILLKDILESGIVDERMVTNGKAFTLKSRYSGATEKHSVKTKQSTMVRVGNIGSNAQAHRVYSPDGKSATLSAGGGGQGGKTGPYLTDGDVRKLTPVECERLQCFPDNYTAGVSNTQRYKQLGNAVNVEVVKHIFKQLQEAK